jgi:hypothetical protein
MLSCTVSGVKIDLIWHLWEGCGKPGRVSNIFGTHPVIFF